MNKQTRILIYFLVASTAAVILFFVLFKSELQFTYEQQSGCGEIAEQLSDSSPSTTQSGEPFVNESPVSEVPTEPTIEQEPQFIETVKCLEDSICEIWDRPGGVSARVYLLVSGPAYELMSSVPYYTGTAIDEEQTYFNARNTIGRVVAFEKREPICSKVKIISVSKRFVFRY